MIRSVTTCDGCGIEFRLGYSLKPAIPIMTNGLDLCSLECVATWANREIDQRRARRTAREGELL